jgi:glycosidase
MQQPRRTSVLGSIARAVPVLAAMPLALGLALVACDNATYVNENPPGGQGGFNPSGASTGAYGYGAAYGTGGSGPPPPPMCDDSLKRCAHAFSYTSQGETSVEVRGDFASDGWTNGVPLTLSGGTWTGSVDVPWNKQVQYKLLLNGTTWIADPANPNQVDDGFGGKNSVLAPETCPNDFTCATPQLGDFDWRDAVLYFAFIDRFADGNPANNGAPTPGVSQAADYRGGDWAGLKQKIDAGYFTDLGVNALWLTVPVDNTEQSGAGTDGHQYSAYHGYWPKNLDQPEEHFGTMADLQAAVQAAHAKKIKVILDYAMNHVHISSPVYQQHNDWFWPLDWGGKHCICGGDCAWDGPDAKRCWFADYLPDFNFTNTDARNYSVQNVLWWVNQTGADGLRLDAIKHVEDQWLLDLRSAITTQVEPVTKQHFYMVGETYTGDQGLIASYVDPVHKLDGQFDFPLRAQILQSMLIRSAPMSALDGFVQSNMTVYGSGIMSTFIGNHDVPRVIHFAEDAPLWGDPWAGGKERAWSNQPGQPGGTSAYERLANAYTLLYTLPGVPLIYYGDEVAMAGAGDPDNRRPMQWSGYNAGQSLVLDRLKKLGAIRAAHVALRHGSRTQLGASNDTMAYKMTSGTDTVYVVLNRGDGAASVGGLPSGSFTDALTGGTFSGPSVQVPARSALILTQ